MDLTCLIVSDDPKSLPVLCRAVDEFKMKRDVCARPEDARRLLNTKGFQAVIVDCHLEGGTELLKSVRLGSSNKNAVTFAILNSSTGTQGAFALGATFVLKKPVSADFMLRNLRAAQSFMLLERRRSFRHPIKLTVTVSSEQGSHSFKSLNISEGGIGLQGVGQLLKARELVTACFQIPEAKLECKSEVVWVTGEGNAGLRFLQVEPSSHKKLQSWLQEKPAQKD